MYGGKENNIRMLTIIADELKELKSPGLIRVDYKYKLFLFAGCMKYAPIFQAHSS